MGVWSWEVVVEVGEGRRTLWWRRSFSSHGGRHYCKTASALSPDRMPRSNRRSSPAACKRSSSRLRSPTWCPSSRCAASLPLCLSLSLSLSLNFITPFNNNSGVWASSRGRHCLEAQTTYPNLISDSNEVILIYSVIIRWATVRH